jgi:hypothetical protein
MMHIKLSSILRRSAIVLVTGALLLIGTRMASAVTLTFEANFDGLQVSPPNASPAFGFGELTLDTVTGNVNVVTGTYQDLLGGASAVSLNGLASPGTNAVSLIPLTLDTPGAATGTFSGGGTLSGPNSLGMQAGDTYLLIRSSVFPGGEIRGQLFPLPVPEPASIVLTILGGLAMAACARRRRARSASC